MKKNLLLTLMLMVAATMLAQDDMPRTEAPGIFFTNEIDYGVVTYYHIEEDPSTVIFYRYAAYEGEEIGSFTDWELYTEPIIIYDTRLYLFEGYAIAPGKLESYISAFHCAYHPDPMSEYIDYDFCDNDIYYKVMSPSTAAVTERYAMDIVNPELNPSPTYSGDIVIPDYVTHVGQTYAVTSITGRAFWQCAVSSVILPNTLTTIDYGSFTECSLSKISIPRSVTTIGTNVFDGCENLTSIVVDNENPIFDSRDHCNAIIETATNTLLYGCKTTVIPNSVTAIGCAFRLCKGLDKVIIPDSVISINGWAFFGCDDVTSVTLGESVSLIGEGAFCCASMTDMTCSAFVPPAASIIFGVDDSGLYDQVKLYVPNESLDAYRAHREWGKFTHIVPFIGAGPGDINGDGSIAIGDVSSVIDLLLDGGDLPAYCDVNGDGEVTIADVSALIDMPLGI